MRMIRALLADDHPAVLEGIRTILAGQDDLVVVGEATTSAEAQRLAEELAPDVLVLGLRMPGPPASEVTAWVRQHLPGTQVLIYTALEEVFFFERLLRAGAAGYVLKYEPREALIRAIRAVAQGDSWFSRSMVEMMLSMQEGPMRGVDGCGLTRRERQVLRLLAGGLDNARIAGELGVNDQTVRNYVSRLYDKLGVSIREQAILWARERGLGEQRVEEGGSDPPQ